MPHPSSAASSPGTPVASPPAATPVPSGPPRRIAIQFEPWFGEEEKQELARVIDSGWVTEAQATREFEERFRTFVGATYAVATTSGTIALTLALMAVGVDAGDEVLVPDMTFAGTATAVRLAGAVPVLVDVDPRTLGMDPLCAEAAITSRTRAIVPVHFNGRPADVRALGALAASRGLHLVEDAAQALGSRAHGRQLGTFGICGCFSLSTPKVITTGQGGMVTTEDPAVAARLVELKDQGRIRRSQNHHPVLGFNFKFTDLQAAVGIAQMRKLPSRLARVAEMYERYRERLIHLGLEMLDVPRPDVQPWHVDVLTDRRDELAAFLTSRQIGWRAYHPALHTQPPFASDAAYPIATRAANRGLWLPSSSFLTDAEIDEVIDAIADFAAGRA